MPAFWEFQDNEGNWKKCRGSDEIITQIKSGKLEFTIQKHKYFISPRKREGLQIHLNTSKERTVRLNDSAHASAQGGIGTQSSTHSISRGPGARSGIGSLSRSRSAHASARGGIGSLSRSRSAHASARGGIGSQSSTHSISRGPGAWGGQPSAGASAWGGKQSIKVNKEKSVIELQNMIDHCNKRFECLHKMLEKNKTLTIVIPTNFIPQNGIWECKCTADNYISKEGSICRQCRIGLSNMGKERAIDQWKSRYGNTFKYSNFIQHLDIKIDELHKIYSSRVSFKKLRKLDDPNIIQLWGANLQNYDNRASKGNIIKGSGQAAFLKKHTQSTYGIITTPVGGVPQQGTNDFDMERFISRNDTVSISHGGPSAHSRSTIGASAMSTSSTHSQNLEKVRQTVIEGRESQFEPYSKTELSRTPQEFIDNFTIASEREEGYEKAMEELEKGKKKGHWFWYVFPQPLNIFDKLIPPRKPTRLSQEYCFNSKEEAIAFIETPDLIKKYFECLKLILDSSNSIGEIMGDDTGKLITSIKHIKLTLETYLREKKGSVNDQQKEIYFYILEKEYKLDNPGVGKLYKRRSKKKKSNKKKSNKKKSNKKKSNKKKSNKKKSIKKKSNKKKSN